MVITSSSFPLLAPVMNKAKKRMSCPDPTTVIHKSINLEDSIISKQQQQQQQQQVPDPRDWEDGPVFRATITQLEAKTRSLKAAIKHILKTATASLRANQALLQADAEFIAALRETSSTEPLFRHYLDDAWHNMRQQREQLQHSMQTLLIDPLQKLYDMDVKQAEVKRRQFEEESKRYYACLSRYLGKKSSNKSENKHLANTRRFDMIRFDYYTFLMDLHCGKKDTELLYHLLNLQQKQHSYHAAMSDILDSSSSGLQAFASLIADASREHTAMYKERSETRKALEAGYKEAAAATTMTTCLVQQPTNPSTVLSNDESRASFGVTGGVVDDRKAESLFHGIRDLQCYDRDLKGAVGRRKEGVLFATSRPLKVNDSDKPPTGVPWHKYWCVLSAGQLYEYSNWKRSLESHMEPVNLRFATVRVARKADRRFCFEVITPKFRRLYQATSQDDMQAWITTINNAIESVLNGQGSVLDLVHPQQEQNLEHKKRPKSWVAVAAASGSHKLSLEGALVNLTTDANKEKKRKLHRHSIGHTQNPANKRRASIGFSSYELIQKVYQADDANTRCADCGEERPEWCSINLGVFLCIECSGIHRGLGSHISKIRSLTLDSNTFTPEVIEMLLSIGNTRANAVWDACNACSTTPMDSRDSKVDYIVGKYQDRIFTNQNAANEATTPQQQLFDAIRINSIPKALEAIALGADVNARLQQQQQQTATVEDGMLNGGHTDNEPQFITLPMLDAEGCHLPDQSLTLPLPLKRQVIPLAQYPLHLSLASGSLAMAEFLFQNGADPSIVDPETGCSLHDTITNGNLVRDRAMSYYLQRINNIQHKTNNDQAILPTHHRFSHTFSSDIMEEISSSSSRWQDNI